MEDFDVIDRIQASSPNLNPIQYYEGPDYICCSEVLPDQRPKICEGSPSRPTYPRASCLRKSKSVPAPCKWPQEINENPRDILYRPIRWRCKTLKNPQKKAHAPSLGAPIGLSKSSFSMNFLGATTSDQALQGLATTLIAFAEYFITPEVEWDENVINRILLEGQRLYNDAKAELHEGEKLKEASFNRSFKLCENTFNLKVNDPFMMGQVEGHTTAVPNFHWGLQKFFKKFQFCLLQIDNWYALLWKSAGIFFIFDCFGRRSIDLQSDRRRGVAVLVCVRHIENVSHLILNLSDVNPETLFILRHLQIKSLIPCGGKPPAEIVDRSIEFEVISSDYALLLATLHLGSSCFKEIRYRHSLPVAFSALINAKIDPTPTWNAAVLNKILKHGAQLYKQWTQCDLSFELGIQDVPDTFIFGQYLVQITVDPLAKCGLWKCTPNYRSSELSRSLKNAFEEGSNILVQIQERSYAIWKKGMFYYILDPYSHQCTLGKKKIVTASLRMCGTLDKMCCIFTQSLLELYEESNYLIHLVKIVKLEELDKIEENEYFARIPCMCTAIPTDGAQEVASLNGSVIGVEGYECVDEVAPIESDSADLDSPGLSQTRLEDYTDMRRGFIDESDEETDDDEDDDIDLDSSSDIIPFDETDDSDSDGSARPVVKEKRPKKKTKKPSGGTTEKQKGKEKAGGDLSDTLESEKESRRKDKSKRKKEKKDKNTESDSEDKIRKVKEKKIPEKEEKLKEIKKVDKKMKENEKKDQNEKQTKKPEKKSEEKSKDKTKPEPHKEEKAKKDNREEEAPKKDASKTQEEVEKPIPERQEKIVPEKLHTEKTIPPVEEPPVTINSNPEKPKETPVDEERVSKVPSNAPIEPADQDDPSNQRRSTKGDPPIDRDSTEIPKTTNTEPRRHRHQRRKQQDGEDSSSSDETPRRSLLTGCKANSYPGYTEDPQNLAVIGSESGSYESLCHLLKSGFRCADRILTMTPWGNYVAFRSKGTFFIFDGCTCNLRSIRHMDLSVGTAGLLCFTDMHSLIQYIESGREAPKPTKPSKRSIVDQICSKYCSR